MKSKQIQKKGILAKFLEQGIRILLIKECKKICNIKINIISSFNQILKGEIKKINITAKDINYKDLLFDKLELEADNLKINFKPTKKELNFINNPIIKFRILLSQNSFRTILFSNKWNWIGNIISREVLNKDQLKDIKISNGRLLMKSSKRNINIIQEEEINIRTERGKIYLENKSTKKTFQIPIEDKIYINNIYIENNIINVSASSSISF